MGLPNKIFAAVKYLAEGAALRIGIGVARLGGFDKVLARYEAAYQQWGQRSFIFGTIQDARYDANSSTRLELVRRHRQWTVNNGIVFRIRNLFIQFSVGVEGLSVCPNSSDEEWNVSRQTSYQQWCRNPELGTNLTMGQLHVQWAGALFDDGGVFIVKTSRNVNGKIVPAIQTVEAHRVATPKELKARENKDIWDGIRLDGMGKPISYFIRRLNESDVYDEFDAVDVIHIFKARRPGMLRGLPEGYSVMNELHDLDDLQMYTMQSAKIAARESIICENESGQNQNPVSLRRAAMNIQSQNAAGQAIVKDDPLWYDVANGSLIRYIKKGTTFKQFQTSRPAICEQQYWDFIVSKICCGYNVPKLLVLPYSLQGTVTRADLDVCTNAFRANFEPIKLAATLIYEWQTEWAVDFDRSMDGKPPPDFLNCMIRPPRAPNVDVGRNAQALALELKIGTLNYQQVFGDRQQDWRQEFRQSAEEAAYLKRLAKEFSTGGIEITVDEIAQKLELKISDPPQKKGQEAPTEEATV